MRKIVRKIHRWLGLLMALQIAAWMLSGFYFSLFPISEIRGEHLVRAPQPPARQALASAPAPAEALAALDHEYGGDWELEALTAYTLDGHSFWRIQGTVGGQPFARLVDFETSAMRPALTAQQARARAASLLLQPGSSGVVEWVEEAPDNLELRGRALPVWRVTFSEPENLRLYLDPWTGEVVARRTDRWRLFDFLWMLHIMDFDTRDDFNHPLLQVAAFSGLGVALGGLLLWAVTTRLFRGPVRG